MRAVWHIVVCSLIVVAGAFAVWLIFETEPEAQQLDAVAESAMLVETTGVERGTFRPTVRALGTVQAAVEAPLAARVSGFVTEVAPTFEPGSLVTEGDVLVALDRDDFRTEVALRESELDQARAEARLEEGQQDIARSEVERYADGLGGAGGAGPLAEGDRDLMLRGPQEDIAEARVDAADAALARARRDLARTRVEAPWDALILSRDVDEGAQIDAGQPLGRLVGTDAYWVVATVQPSLLRWLVFADDIEDLDVDAESAGDLDASAVVRDRVAWPEGAHRDARLLRPIGALEEGTRLARILVEVQDPLARREDHRTAPPLLLGAFVEVSLRARPVEDVIRIQRELVRDGDTVWVMEDDVLRIRDVEVVFSDPDYAYVSAGLEADDRIVVTNLATVVDGAPLRVAPPSTPAAGTGDGTGEGAPP